VLCQGSYIEKITHTLHLEYAKPASTPMALEELIPYDEKATPQEIYTYQRKIDSILYPAIITRPDTTHTATKLSEFL